MQPSDEDQRRPRKRRTREHVIADLSENYLERLVLLRGHLLQRPNRDYGVDVTMFHFSDSGEIENGEVRFQLKATDAVRKVDKDRYVSLPIEVRDLLYCAVEIYPFILVAFDAQEESAYWCHIQVYVDANRSVLEGERKTSNIRIPVGNKLTVSAIDQFRQLSLQAVKSSMSMKEGSDDKRKPR